ncbi:PspA/IM30 family protein [Laceyella putida]|uniref:PspA/IM30 family protein n=1 Tax=Laceyella putida TaxID=110101 RepID=A0ABW2RFQ9_9BACL
MAWKRIRDYLMATYHEIMDDVEKPESMLKQYLRDIEKEIGAAKEVIIKQQMLTKQFTRQAEEAKNLAARREEQTRIAQNAGEEKLAEKALAEMKYYEAKAQEYEGYAQKSIAQTEDLRHQVSKLEKKYQDLKDKKNELVARAAMAQANQRIHAMLSFTASESLLKEFQRIEDRIAEMEIRAKVYANASLGEMNAGSAPGQIALNPAKAGPAEEVKVSLSAPEAMSQ